MKKSDYLKDGDVDAFVQWMRHNLAADSRRGHAYVQRRGAAFEFRNLSDAYAKYDWPFRFEGQDGRSHAGRSFDENAAVLSGLQQRLRSALGIEDEETRDDAVHAAAIDVMRWGGVAPRNEPWLRANKAGLADTLKDVAARIGQDDDDTPFPAKLRFNAGMTKVYSLLVPNFIIYDSRVAAALAWFVAAWARETNRDSIPEPLQFCCMDAKEAPNAARPKLRNPSAGTLTFPPLRNRPLIHVKWNLRASWILEALLAQSAAKAFGTGPEASRKLEAALFMWGYDLTPAL